MIIIRYYIGIRFYVYICKFQYLHFLLQNYIFTVVINFCNFVNKLHTDYAATIKYLGNYEFNV